MTAAEAYEKTISESKKAGLDRATAFRLASNAYKRIWKRENRDKVARYQRERRARNPQRARLVYNAWRAKNAESQRSKFRKWRAGNRDKAKAACDKWFSANKQKVWDRRAVRHRQRIEADPIYDLRFRLRNSIGRAIKKGRGKRTPIEKFGCSIEDLKLHIEAQFTDGMGWHNRKLWHIDHIFPLDGCLGDEAKIKRSFHFKNLRPIWASENCRKSSKITPESLVVAKELGL